MTLTAQPIATPRRAGFCIRLLATLIDVFAYGLILAAVIAVGMTMGAVPVEEDHPNNDALAAVTFACWLLYSSFEVWSAGTPGKRLLRLRIAALDGAPADFWVRVLRWSTKQFWLLAAFLHALTGFQALYALSGFVSLVLLVGCLHAANDDHLAWHDQWSHTAVYHRPRSTGATWGA